MERTIVHMDLDSFFVSVERLLNSKLKGKPVIVGGTSDRGVVAACSYEARTFGVHSAMPMRMARILCPQAIYIRGDYDQYTKYSSMVTQIIAEKVPLFEKSSIDEHYIDMSGMDKFHGCFKYTHELRQFITKETGLPISFGLSENKTVAKVATDQSKPNGELEVLHERIKPFLFPLSVEKLPYVGPKTSYTLKSMGVFTIQGLAEIPIELMQKVFGENGIIMSERANGIDNTPVEPYMERKSISEENTFEQDIIDIQRIEYNLTSMVENLCYQLRKEKRLTSCIVVKLRYANFETNTQQSRIPHTAADHLIRPKVLEIFRKLYERRMRIRLIGVKFTNLVSGTQQINLFEDSVEMVNLYQAIDRMKKRFGEKALFHATKLNT